MSLNSIPVFVFPDSLTFDDISGSLTKTLSLYNPYDFNVQFQILATDPNLFALSSSEGLIRARHCLDVVVRLKGSQQQQTTRDFNARFLIKVHELNAQNARAGERQIHVTSKQSTNETREESFHEMRAQEHVEVRSRDMSGSRVSDLNKNALIGIGLALSLLLLVPHDSESTWSLSVTHKLVIAYILGLITVLILRN